MTGFVTPERFQLTEGEKNHSLWFRLKLHLTDELERARCRNDALLPEPETAMLRGEIRILKKLIALGDTRPIVVGDENAH